MQGMPFAQALIFFLSVAVLIVATQRRAFHPFLAILVVASAFGFIAGLPISVLGRSFGAGFSEMIYSPGLVIVAASLIAGLAESTGACDRLSAKIDGWRRFGPNAAAALFGLIAGVGASPSSAFALLTPIYGTNGAALPEQRRATVTLGLATSASHGLLLTPVQIAATAILGAAWERVALFGVPLTILLVVLSAALASRLPIASPQSQPSPPQQPVRTAEQPSRGSALVLALAIAIPMLLLMVQSIGDIPSEPLGGGATRELILAVGRPLILFLVGIGIMLAGQPRRGFGLVADAAGTARIIANVSGILLIVCAAGGLQRLCQETGMAEMAGDYLLGWHVPVFAGVLVPFLVAAVIKTLQGSSLVAAITAAGMMQPMLTSLGLGDANGKALAALAVGAGAMTIPHVNDEFFWLVTTKAGLSPLRGLTTISLGALLQGLVAMTILLLIAFLASHS